MAQRASGVNIRDIEDTLLRQRNLCLAEAIRLETPDDRYAGLVWREEAAALDQARAIVASWAALNEEMRKVFDIL